MPESNPPELLASLLEKVVALRRELANQIVGQDAVVDDLIVALLAGGHCLIQGAPGLAKTRLISTLAKAADLKFGRIQFTPDLMPSDITGSEILQEDTGTARRGFEFLPGPLFANLVLADEVNRAPPKTQAALLEAMQEQQVSIGRTTLPLPQPFFVLATQNPIEQEGTYPLPEAQLDRFMFMILIGYPGRSDELDILKNTDARDRKTVQQVIDGPSLLQLQQLVRQMPLSDDLYEYALQIIRATRPAEAEASDFVRHWLSWGAGPRAGQHLVRAAQARALLRGRVYVKPEDVKASAAAVLQHRLVLNFNARAEGVTVMQIIEKLLTLIPAPGEKRW